MAISSRAISPVAELLVKNLIYPHSEGEAKSGLPATVALLHRIY